MKRVILNSLRRNQEDIFGMANLNPFKSGLSVIIWSDHSGVRRNVSHSGTPRIKIGTNKDWVSVTISSRPVIKAKSGHIKKSVMDKIDEGIDYVARNYDLFLKHYNDIDFSFDDEDLFQALRERGEYS